MDKFKRKQFYQDFIAKKSDNGLRHYHCGKCFREKNELVKGSYVDGVWYCKCGEYWTIIA